MRGPVLYNVRDFLAGGEIHAGDEQVSFHTPRSAPVLDAHLVDEHPVERSADGRRFLRREPSGAARRRGPAALVPRQRRDGLARAAAARTRRPCRDVGSARWRAGAAWVGSAGGDPGSLGEGGLDPAAYTALGAHLDDHGGWGFTAVFTGALSRAIALRRNRECARLEWIRRDQIHTLNLHPGPAAM